jgi:hypothetical protein
MALLDVQARVAHCAGGVVEEPLLLGGRHQPEKIARLLPRVECAPVSRRDQRRAGERCVGGKGRQTPTRQRTVVAAS